MDAAKQQEIDALRIELGRLRDERDRIAAALESVFVAIWPARPSAPDPCSDLDVLVPEAIYAITNLRAPELAMRRQLFDEMLGRVTRGDTNPNLLFSLERLTAPSLTDRETR
jgi:hypothetical protein